MIIDSARALKEVADEVSLLRRSRQHAQALLNRSRRLTTLLDRSEVAIGAARTLGQRLGEPWTPPARLAGAEDAIDRWRTALDEDLGAALGGDLFAAVEDGVERVLADVERRASSSWKRYTAQMTPETSQAILSALSADRSARSTVITIRRLADSVNRLRERQIPTADQIAEFDKAVSDLRAAWATLDVASLNTDVVGFLRAANSDRGASLSLLTEPVQNWLMERHLDSHYVIRPSD